MSTAGMADAGDADPVPDPVTVRADESDVLATLQVAGRSEAIVRARDAGLGWWPVLHSLPVARPRTGASRLA